MTYFVESGIICLIYYLFRAVFFLKQKVYTLLIVLTAIIFSASFLIAFSEDKNTGDFEVFIISTTNTDTLYNSITSETETSQTVTETVNTTSSEKKKTKTSSTKETQVSAETAVITDTTETEGVNFPIDINSAGIDELKTLDGIGDATASKIIEYRETYGNFRNREELLNVSGIGEKKLEKIYDFIFVENESYDEPDNFDSEIFNEPEIYDDNDYNNHEQSEETDFSDEQNSVPKTEPTEITTEEFILINLNTALKEDFMKLPYVDENIADDIIELRNMIQYFSHPYELLMVESLTQQQVAEIIKFVTVE
ncbi:MAG TPA: hypothetical protein DCQ78_03355 [Ruminococcus sp.]|nr:hypothetical protein [Ruminococcus sp.]